jgi:hypothetical protein
MKVAGIYSFNDGERVVRDRYADLLGEAVACIESIDARSCKLKKSREKTMKGQMLFSPVLLNEKFKEAFYPNG